MHSGFGNTGIEVCSLSLGWKEVAAAFGDCYPGRETCVCSGSQTRFISYTYCKMQRKRALKKLSWFVEEESITGKQFIWVKHSCFAS